MKLTLNDVRFGYGETENIHGITYAVSGGKVTGLIGPNGSGKTTLIKLIHGSLMPSAGTIELDGKQITNKSAKARARMMALVPQRSLLEFDFTVLDMVLMGRQPHMGRFDRESAQDLALARDAMARMGLEDLEKRNARTLSGGEWQRVLIARALCQQTPLLLMDEPVSNLDIRHQMEVLREIRTLSRDKAASCVLVLHDLNLAAHYCDELLLLDHGEQVAQGTPAQVLTAELIDQVYGIKTHVYTDEEGFVTVNPHYI